MATDLSRRALAFARFTAALDGVDLDLRAGSLLEPVAGERFDLVVGADGLHSQVRALAFGPAERFERSLGCVVAAVRIAIRNPLRPLGEAAFGLLGPGRDGRGARWLSTTPPDRDRGSLLELLGRVEFLELGKLREAIPGLSPGTLLVFTDQSTASLPPVVQRRVVTTSGEDRGMGAKAQTKPSSRPVGPATPRPARRKPVRERYPVPETVPNSV